MRTVSAEQGFRIMLAQFGFGLLFRISITVLKDAYGPFLCAINFGELIVVVSVPPVADFNFAF